jgi:hypothetical protein
MKKLIIIIIFLMTSLLGTSQFTSDVSGDWTTGTNWAGDVAPTLVGGNKLNDNTTIASGTIIDLTSDLEISSGTTLIINGRLNVSGNITFKNGSTVLVNVGGILHILSSGANANNSTDVTIDGQLLIDNDFEAGAGSTIGGVGEVTISGTSSGDGTIFGDATGCSGCSFSGGGSLPITLVYFDAEEYNNSICLTWVVASQVNNNYFTIYKSYDGYEWEDVVDIEGHGTTNIMTKYEWYDNHIEYGTVYYKLRQTDFNGEFEEFLPIAVTIVDPNRDVKIINTINLIGVEVKNNYKGFIINIYNNGKIEKLYKNN